MTIYLSDPWSYLVIVAMWFACGVLMAKTVFRDDARAYQKAFAISSVVALALLTMLVLMSIGFLKFEL
jgi:hypothetical protein